LRERTPEKGQFAVILLQSENQLHNSLGEVCLVLVEEIWVNVAQATKITGYNLDHVRRLARDNWRLPEDQRRIRVRKDGHAYAIWLPDLISYFGKDDNGHVKNADEEIWVNTTEGEELTGYNRAYLSQLAGKMWDKPEAEREIKTKKRAGGYEMWLPDLLRHKQKGRRGPKKNKKLTT
jgi:hypothetical protein